VTKARSAIATLVEIAAVAGIAYGISTCGAAPPVETNATTAVGVATTLALIALCALAVAVRQIAGPRVGMVWLVSAVLLAFAAFGMWRMYQRASARLVFGYPPETQVDRFIAGTVLTRGGKAYIERNPTMPIAEVVANHRGPDYRERIWTPESIQESRDALTQLFAAFVVTLVAGVFSALEGTWRSFVAAPTRGPKTKILFVASNPQTETALSLAEEIRTITNKIREAEYRDTLELESCWAARPDDLLLRLNESSPTIVHFSGHGTEEGELLLNADNEAESPVTTDALKSLFTVLRGKIRLVVLSACYSERQADAIVETIDCVVGMKAEVADEAAITFAGSFYRALGFGKSVQEAFEQGKTGLLLANMTVNATPVIRSRSGVDAGAIRLAGPA
jgi:hypothetical protein